MSDMKPKRIAREPGHGEVAAGGPAPVGTVPLEQGAMVTELIAAEAPAVAEVISVARQQAGQIALETAAAAADPSTDSADDPWTAVAETHAVLARGCAAVAVELTGMTGSGIAAAGDAAVALLGARTVFEAVEINAGLVRRGLDATIGASVRLFEIGAISAGEVSQSMLLRVGATWNAATVG